jgi:hypothetical protein
MRYCTQAGFVNELARDPADAVSFILNAHHRFFQVVNELDLAARHLTQLFSFHAHASILHGHVASIFHISSFILAGD